MEKIESVEELTEKHPGLVAEIKRIAREEFRSKKHGKKSMTESERIRAEAKRKAGM